MAPYDAATPPIPDRVLDLAIRDGLIQPGQAIALRSLARQEALAGMSDGLPEPVDEERLRFVTGFADIFVTIGIALFLGATAYLIGRATTAVVTTGTAAALAWALAEFFTRIRRMALPSIVLLVVFAATSFATLAILLDVSDAAVGRSIWGWPGHLMKLDTPTPVRAALAGLGTAALVGLHYWRFRVPITIAAGLATLLFCALMVLFALDPEMSARTISIEVLVSGLVAFAVGMAFDLRDPQRLTRRTDIAFWLHLLAAPLIVHSLFALLDVVRGPLGPGSASLVLAIFAGLAIVALVVDRRAILVSGLAYAGWALTSLIRNLASGDTTGAIAIMLMGAVVLLLSAGWAPLRRALLSMLPHDFAARLPRPQ